MCSPPARKPARSWLSRRSTMATSTRANASSAANISPVGPPPTMTTSCSIMAAPHAPAGKGAHAASRPGPYRKRPAGYTLKVPGNRSAERGDSVPLAREIRDGADQRLGLHGLRDVRLEAGGEGVGAILDSRKRGDGNRRQALGVEAGGAQVA